MELSILNDLASMTKDNSVGQVIVAGYWDHNAIEMLISNKPKNITILEPQNEACSQIIETYIDQPNVQVKDCTLAEKEGLAKYFLFHPKRFSSLVKPKKLQKIYKKRSLNSVLEVTTIDLKGLCRQQNISQENSNVLLLGTNCPSTQILNSDQLEALKLFDVIVISHPKPDLYDCTDEQGDFSAFLTANNFILSSEINRDALYSTFVFKQDHQLERINTLEENLAAVILKSDALEKKLSDSIDENARLVETSESQLTGMREKNVTLNAEGVKLKERNERLSNHNRQLIEQSEALDLEVREFKDRNEKLSNHNRQLIDQNDVLNADAKEFKDRNDKLSNHNRQLIDQNEAFKAAELELKERNEKLKKHNIKLIERDEQLSATIKESKEKTELLVSENTQVKNQKEALAVKIGDQTSEIAKLVSEKEFLSSKNNELELSIADLDNELVKLEAQIELVNKVFIED